MKRLVIWVAAATVPFCVVSASNLVAGTLMSSREPGQPQRVENFSDYMPRDAARSDELIGRSVPVWTGSPGTGARWFNDFAVTSTSIVLVSSKLVLVVDKSSGNLVRSDTLADHSPAFGSATSIMMSQSEQLWLYSFGSGQLMSYSVTEGLTDPSLVERKLHSVRWLGEGRIVGSGLFANDLFHVYDVVRRGGGVSPDTPPPSFSLARAMGPPLFPQLKSDFAKQLNMASLTVSPAGAKMAAALRWSDKILIYDGREPSLERTVAGPVTTKLDFAVVDYRNQAVFTLAPESAHSYVDVISTDRAILALYSGIEQRRGWEFGLGSQIHEFSWDGRLLGVWRLPEPLQKIRWDPATRELYGLRWKPQPSVVKWSSGSALGRDL